MKKNVILLLLTTAFFTTAVLGCGRKNQNNSNDNGMNVAGTENAIDNVGTEAIMGTEDNTSQLQLGSAVEIPESFNGQLAETDAHKQLEKVIAEYCSVTEEDYANVRYYYNYVDLNGDSKNEILALVLGQEVEGINGNMLLWLDGADDDNISTDSVKQVFRQVGAPVYISNHMTQGYRDLIISDNQNAIEGAANEGNIDGTGSTSDGSNESGTDVDVSNAGRTVDGDETSLQRTAGLDDTTGENGASLISMDQAYMLLTWTGEKYQELEEGTALFSLEGYEGTAILTNNIESDFANDNYHFLGEAMR